ncbi:hypothetical protein [Neorhodopirellula pilleata]|uniref:Uncharacterized protein n=1 Tax=Neorhodopirellula pilleata TaxID=2714738 RepID=A0A5C5ZWM4_9BACT|nr:hypothetical protein [Neorhodopirellula pilleata]TWT91411.1 hypothetical protein Pla100_52610 [Neorhodopirellula pilleata]TWT91460.1 hypothetical protein Pla100_53100 [Neorhodopirellula pilleata]
MTITLIVFASVLLGVIAIRRGIPQRIFGALFGTPGVPGQSAAAVAPSLVDPWETRIVADALEARRREKKLDAVFDELAEVINNRPKANVPASVAAEPPAKADSSSVV